MTCRPQLDDTGQALLQGLVRAGREQLPLVQIDDAQIDQLASFALACGVEGHRADTFAWPAPPPRWRCAIMSSLKISSWPRAW